MDPSNDEWQDLMKDCKTESGITEGMSEFRL